jgi:signal transduction histidine kinase
MRRWPLKLKVGLYCATLTVLALVASAAIILPLIYHRQVQELDENLTDDQQEVFRSLEAAFGPNLQINKPVTLRVIPLQLRMRYVQLEGPNHDILFKSSNLRDSDLRELSPGIQTVRLFNRNCRVGTFQKGPLTLHIGTRLGTIEGMQEDLRSGFYVALPILAIFVFAGGLLLAHHALQPVTAMTAAAERISAQSPSERLPAPSGNDEISRLTVVLNQSFDRLQRAYDAAARFSADASHQLKTPIAVLRAGLDELRLCSQLPPDDKETVDVLLQQTRRLTTLVEDLLLLAQADAGRLRLDPAPLDLVPLLSVVVDDIEALSSDNNIQVVADYPPELFARADARRVKIILQNLGENAVKYNVPSGRIIVTGRRMGNFVTVSVANTGKEIPASQRDRLFERFNRAGMGENIKGHGLGLNIARELARAHGGDLVLVRSQDGWTEFMVRLPVTENPGVSGDIAAASASAVRPAAHSASSAVTTRP